MDDLIVTVFGKALFEEFVGQYASLGEAIHCPSNPHINIAIFGFVVEMILVIDVGWDDLKRYAPVFVTVERCGEVEQLEIGREVASIGGADGTVPKYLRCD